MTFDTQMIESSIRQILYLELVVAERVRVRVREGERER